MTVQLACQQVKQSVFGVRLKQILRQSQTLDNQNAYTKMHDSTQTQTHTCVVTLKYAHCTQCDLPAHPQTLYTRLFFGGKKKSRV